MSQQQPPGTFGPGEPIDRLSPARHAMIQDPRRTLEPAEIERVGRVVLGEVRQASRADRVAALHLLARRGGPTAAEVISKVLGERSEDPALRSAAASALALAPSRQAERALLGGLRVQEEIVLLKTLRSLAAVGGQDAFTALQQLPESDSRFVRNQTLFARALIAYRLDLPVDPLESVEGTEGGPEAEEERLELRVRRADTDRIRQEMDRFEGTLFGVEVAPDIGFDVAAGRAEWLVLLERDAVKEGIRQALVDRKWVLALMARRARVTGTYSVEYVVLTRPVDDEGMRIVVLRTDGEVLHAGAGRSRDGVLDFTVTHLERPGAAPMKVTGSVGPEGVEFEVSLLTARRREKRQAQPLTVEDLKRRG
jgi:hypothetical protein